MPNVKNKSVVRRLSDRSLKANRMRNSIAVIAIILTTVLFTSLFTIGIGLGQSMQQQTMRQSGGNAHGAFKGISREEYEKLKATGIPEDMADNMICADRILNPEFLKRHVEFWYYPEDKLDWYFIEISGGHFPREADEIMMDTMSLELLGIPCREGEQVTLQMSMGEYREPFDRTFTLSGWYEPDPALNVGFGLVSKAYLTEHAQELWEAASENESGNVGKIFAYVKFSNSRNIQEKMDEMIEAAGYSTDPDSPDYMESNANWAYLSEGTGEIDAISVIGMGAVLLIILTAGYLIIYNIFQISVVKDIQFYGLLKTIGTTGRQIKKIIRRQSWRMSVVGIPLGLVVGFIIGKLLLPVIFNVSTSSGKYAVVTPNPAIFIGAAIFTLFTVWISTMKPARTAARVSPVEAVSYTGLASKKRRKKHKKTAGGAKLYRMAMSNLGRNKKQTVVVLLSLSLSVILLNSVFMILHSFDTDKYLERFVDMDYLIGHADYFNYGYRGDDPNQAVSENFINNVQSQEGFEAGGKLYGSSDISVDMGSYQVPPGIARASDGTVLYPDSPRPANVDQNGNYSGFLYGMEDLPLSRLKIWKGETDPDVIREKLNTGKYILGTVTVDDDGSVEEYAAMHQVGDMITLKDREGKVIGTYEILSIVKSNYYPQTCRIGFPFSYYTTAEQYGNMASEDLVMTYAFNVRDDREEAMNQFLKQYTDNVEPTMNYESKFSWLGIFDDMTSMFTTVGMALALVVGLIGILNFINSVLTGIITRRKEFAMLESIGMTSGQLKKLMVLEGCYYAAFTALTSTLLTFIFSFTALRTAANALWFMSFRFTMVPMLAVIPILLVLGAAVPLTALKAGGKQPVVERLREN